MALFETAMAELITAFQAEVALDSVTYHRGVTSVTLIKKIWVDRTAFRVSENGNSRLLFSDKDFLIPVADLIIGGVQVVPGKEDWIEVNFAGPEGNQKFQPMVIKDEPFWKYADPQRTLYLIHTKRRALA